MIQFILWDIVMMTLVIFDQVVVFPLFEHFNLVPRGEIGLLNVAVRGGEKLEDDVFFDAGHIDAP